MSMKSRDRKRKRKMNKFTIRKECPVNNKFYNKTTDGGLNTCVYGYPIIKGCSTLADCTGYASGRFNEIISEIKGKDAWYYDLNSDAGSFIKYGAPMGLKVSQTPQAGSIMVWDVTGVGGHVCVVEEVISNDRVMISQSNWGGPTFEYKAKTNANGNWGLNKSRYKFLGFLLNPAVTEEQDTSSDTKHTDTYTVVKGDTMYKIAALYHCKLSE